MQKPPVLQIVMHGLAIVSFPNRGKGQGLHSVILTRLIFTRPRTNDRSLQMVFLKKQLPWVISRWLNNSVRLLDNRWHI
jgi:hypothetical protein